MFITSINLEGPFNKQYQWQDVCFPFPGNVRIPVKPVPNVPSPSAPIWATPGLHTCSPEEVYQWKHSIPNTALVAAMDPYWTSNQSGKVFIEGMQRLAGYSRQEVSHDGEQVRFSKSHITLKFSSISYTKSEKVSLTPKTARRMMKSITPAPRYKEMLDADCGLEAPILHPAGSLARSGLASPVIPKRPPTGSTKNGKRREPPTQGSPLAKRTRPASPPEASGSGKAAQTETSPTGQMITRSKARREAKGKRCQI